MTYDGDFRYLARFTKWFASQPHKYKVLIAGNHDLTLDTKHSRWNPVCSRLIIERSIHQGEFVYLEDGVKEIAGLKFYGSPYTRTYFDWAFMESEEQLAERWKKIPDDTDILVTHGPPKGILDSHISREGHRREELGSPSLLERVNVVKPKLHVFGHIHGTNGVVEKDGTIFVNAALMDSANNLVYKPIVIDL